MLMRIVVLNIRAGGGKRVGELLRYLDQYDPDTVVLTEWRRSFPGTRIEAWAQERGMRYAALNDGGTANGAFIASKNSFTVTSETPPGKSAGVLLLVEFDAFALLACYLPIMNAKKPFFARCAEIANEHAGAPFLMVGDLNTGNQNLDREPRGVRYHCANDFDGLTIEHGLHDLWRRSNGADTREWTCLSNARNGFRLDHAFANSAFVEWARPVCRYDHVPREAKWTDHSAVIVTCVAG
jgi:exodeoxyribonuclease-3